MNVSSLDNTFGNFEKCLGTEKALKVTRAMAEGKTVKPFLLLCGGVGNGKTHLLEAMVIKLRERGVFCRYMVWGQVARVLLTSIKNKGSLSYDEILNNYCQSKAPLLLDDIGLGETQSGWEYSPLEEIVNYRYREKLMTVMVSNKDISELPDRLVSRFSDPDVGEIVVNSGKDYRRQKV